MFKLKVVDTILNNNYKQFGVSKCPFSYDGMNRINEYIKSVGGIQQEQWKFYYGPTGIEKATRKQNGIQNLTIDYSTDTNGRILSAAYNETGGFNGNLAYVYDNYGNVADLLKDNGDPAKAILINPNNSAIDTRYNPNGIDDPFTYRARDGFMSIGNLWANGGGTVYIQGHPVIPNPWGNVSTNGTTTTTTTDDTTDKSGGDSEGNCENAEDCNSLLSQFNENWTLEKGWIAAKNKFTETGAICTPTLV